MKKKLLAVLLVGTMALSLVACGGGEDSSDSNSKKSEKKEYLEESQLSELFTKPDSFKGKYVKLTGKIFTDPEKDGDEVAIQAWHDPQNAENNFIVYYTGTETFKTNDFIEIDGEISGTFKGENVLGTAVTAPLINADSVEVLSYIDAVVPTITEITPENAVAEQNGISINVDKIEFAEKETRVYITETNSSDTKCGINVFDIKLLQNGKQISQDTSSMSIYDGGYAELPYELLAGASSSGVLVFPAMDSSASFQVHAEGYSDNFEIQFSPFIIDISAQ